MTDVESAARLLAELTPADVLTLAAPIDARHVHTLRPAESDSLGAVVERRRAEFATGRHVLRQLLDTEVAIPIGSDRAPVLPAGWVGSLSHDSTVAVAAVAPSSAYAAIGLDVEPSIRLGDDEAAIVLRDDDLVDDACVALVLKEAVYKALSRLGAPILEFHDVRLVVRDGSFSAECRRVDRVVTGRWGSTGSLLLGCVTVGAAAT